MNGRRVTLAALVATVMVLLGSMTATAFYITSHNNTTSSAAAIPQSNDQGGWGGTQNGQDGWNDMGGMMGDYGDRWMSGDGWTGGAEGPVTLDAARILARGWVDANTAGASLDAGTAVSGAYRFTATQNGQVVALLWVEADTGRISARIPPTPSSSPAR